MAKSDLKKVQREAKKIREKHPGYSQKTVMKEAWRKTRGSVSGTKKKKTKKRSVGATKVGTKPKYKVIHEVRRINGISYTGGKVSIRGTGQVSEQRGRLKAMIGEEIGWLEVAKSSASTKREREAIQKKITEKRAELNRIK
jgi:hypothetical protein